MGPSRCRKNAPMACYQHRGHTPTTRPGTHTHTHRQHRQTEDVVSIHAPLTWTQARDVVTNARTPTTRPRTHTQTTQTDRGRGQCSRTPDLDTTQARDVVTNTRTPTTKTGHAHTHTHNIDRQSEDVVSAHAPLTWTPPKPGTWSPTHAPPQQRPGTRTHTHTQHRQTDRGRGQCSRTPDLDTTQARDVVTNTRTPTTKSGHAHRPRTWSVLTHP